MFRFGVFFSFFHGWLSSDLLPHPPPFSSANARHRFLWPRIHDNTVWNNGEWRYICTPRVCFVVCVFGRTTLKVVEVS